MKNKQPTSKAGEKCIKRFLWLQWEDHDWQKIDIRQESKYIGKVPKSVEEGIFIIVWKIFIKEKCSRCHKRRERLDRQFEETRRRYH